MTDSSSSEQALHLLQTIFGYPSFRGQQAEIVDLVAHGDDALVLMPTGGGKSLCYQIPSLLRDGVGVVVSPLIALMQDQVDALAEVGVRAAFLNSTQTFDEAMRIERRVRSGDLDLVYVAPERLMPDVLALATELASRPRLSLALIKQCVLQGSEMPLIDGLRFEQEAFWKTMRSDDAARLMRAYLSSDRPLNEQ